MPGRLYQTHGAGEISAALGVDAGVPEPRIEISPGDMLAVLTPERVLRDMRWSMIMGGRRNARGRPVMETIVNARSETVLSKSAFAEVRRGVVAVTGWYEWTGKTRRKTRWRLCPADGRPALMAAIWDVWQGPGGVELAQCATVTCEPNAEVAEIHHRMPVLLDMDGMAVWLGGTEEAAAEVLRTAADGSVAVEEARDVQGLIGH